MRLSILGFYIFPVAGNPLIFSRFFLEFNIMCGRCFVSSIYHFLLDISLISVCAYSQLYTASFSVGLVLLSSYWNGIKGDPRIIIVGEWDV